MNSFMREADMLRPIVDNAASFLSQDRNWEHFYEIQSPKGVIDIVFVVFDEAVLRRRRRWQVSPAQEKSSVDILIAMSKIQDSRESGSTTPLVSTTAELAKRTLYSTSYIRRRILPSLTDLGWVERIGSREWVSKHPYESPVKILHAIEVKRGDWQRGLMQAAPHTEFADSTYLALDAARLPKTRESVYRSLKHAGLGLISVSNDPQDQDALAVLLQAPEGHPVGNERYLVSERLLAVRESGGNSGFWGHVFGRMVTTSSGEDPRNSVI